MLYEMNDFHVRPGLGQPISQQTAMAFVREMLAA
jgi:hypothetical protein